MAKRRALPASERDRLISKSVIGTDAVAESGKAPPARGVKPSKPKKAPPKVDEVGKAEEPATETEVDKDCGCGGGTEIAKPLLSPGSGEDHETFMTRCMGDDTMAGEFPDGKQRYAVCLTRWKETAKAEEPPTAEDADPPPNSEAKERGVMVALCIPGAVAKAIAIEGQEPVEQLHVTMAYMGKIGEDITEEQVDALKKCLPEFMAGRKAMKGVIGGVGRFSASDSSDGMDVLYASPDIPELSELRYELVKHIEKCGCSVFKNHGYTPHITLAYIPSDGPMPVDKVQRIETEFDRIMLVAGGERTEYPLGPVMKAFTGMIEFAKAEQRLVTGIVLQPEVVDAQGDIIDSDTIREAAHRFLAEYNRQTQMGLQHKLMDPGVDLVESWIAPVDFTIGNRAIKAGTWMITTRINDDQIWSAIKEGKITGYSIGGMAKVAQP